MAGRPTLRTEEINSKIEEAAALGSSIEEIAFYIGVWRTTLYRWMKEDPELKDRIEELQERPIIKARQTIVKDLDNPERAQWYLERKKRNEFSTRTETDHSGAINVVLTNELAHKYNVIDTKPSDNSEGLTQVQSS